MAVNNSNSKSLFKNEKRKVHVHNFGCKSNLADSYELKRQFLADGFKNSATLENSDVVVINTCAVTDEATKQAVRFTKKALLESPNAKVVVTGCAAEVEPHRFTALSSERIKVIGNGDKPRLLDLLQAPEQSTDLNSQVLGSVKPYQSFLSVHPADRDWYEPKYGDGFGVTGMEATEAEGVYPTRAFFKVQEGCNSFCTYCIIPYGRGPSRSLSAEVITDQINTLAQAGVQEVVLTATNLGDYQDENLLKNPSHSSESLLALLKKLDLETSIPRIRLTSLDPDELTEEFVSFCLKSNRICAHFHVSIQSLTDTVLKRMKRKYKLKQIERVFAQIEKHNQENLVSSKRAFVGVDLITGFPGESESEFEEAFQWLSANQAWDRLHVFPYSERAETPATKLPQVVRQEIRVQRAKRLRDLSQERQKQSYKSLLKAVPELAPQVLWEQSTIMGPDGTREWLSGYTPNYFRILKRRSDQELDIRKPEHVPLRRGHLWLDVRNQDVSFYLF